MSGKIVPFRLDDWSVDRRDLYKEWNALGVETIYKGFAMMEQAPAMTDCSTAPPYIIERLGEYTKTASDTELKYKELAEHKIVAVCMVGNNPRLYHETGWRGREVTLGELKAGDIVFFKSNEEKQRAEKRRAEIAENAEKRRAEGLSPEEDDERLVTHMGMMVSATKIGHCARDRNGQSLYARIEKLTDLLKRYTTCDSLDTLLKNKDKRPLPPTFGKTSPKVAVVIPRALVAIAQAMNPVPYDQKAQIEEITDISKRHIAPFTEKQFPNEEASAISSMHARRLSIHTGAKLNNLRQSMLDNISPPPLHSGPKRLLAALAQTEGDAQTPYHSPFSTVSLDPGSRASPSPSDPEDLCGLNVSGDSSQISAPFITPERAHAQLDSRPGSASRSAFTPSPSFSNGGLLTRSPSLGSSSVNGSFEPGAYDSPFSAGSSRSSSLASSSAASSSASPSKCSPEGVIRGINRLPHIVSFAHDSSSFALDSGGIGFAPVNGEA